MKTTINVHDFIAAFRTHDRHGEFSHAGKHALFEYLEELEEGIGTEMELDVVALCCEYTEYSSAIKAAKEFSIELESEDADEQEEEALEYFQAETIVIAFNGSIIAQNF